MADLPAEPAAKRTPADVDKELGAARVEGRRLRLQVAANRSQITEAIAKMARLATELDKLLDERNDLTFPEVEVPEDASSLDGLES